MQSATKNEKSTAAALACIALLIYFGYMYGLTIEAPKGWFQLVNVPQFALDLFRLLFEVFCSPLALITIAVPAIFFGVGLHVERQYLSRKSLAVAITQVPNLVCLLWGVYWKQKAGPYLDGLVWQVDFVTHSVWIVCALVLLITAAPFVTRTLRSQRRLFLWLFPMQFYLTIAIFHVSWIAVRKPI